MFFALQVRACLCVLCPGVQSAACFRSFRSALFCGRSFRRSDRLFFIPSAIVYMYTCISAFLYPHARARMRARLIIKIYNYNPPYL